MVAPFSENLSEPFRELFLLFPTKIVAAELLKIIIICQSLCNTKCCLGESCSLWFISNRVCMLWNNRYLLWLSGELNGCPQNSFSQICFCHFSCTCIMKKRAFLVIFIGKSKLFDQKNKEEEDRHLKYQNVVIIWDRPVLTRCAV